MKEKYTDSVQFQIIWVEGVGASFNSTELGDFLNGTIATELDVPRLDNTLNMIDKRVLNDSFLTFAPDAEVWSEQRVACWAQALLRYDSS